MHNYALGNHGIGKNIINNTEKINQNQIMKSNILGLKDEEGKESLESVFKRQDHTNMIVIQMNFIKKKSGEDKLINILRLLDKGQGEITEEEATEKIISIVGQVNYNSIHQTLQRVLKISNYKFKK